MDQNLNPSQNLNPIETVNGLFRIRLGFSGFNTRANQKGYKSAAAALAAHKRCGGNPPAWVR